MYKLLGPFVHTDDTPGSNTAVSDVLCDTGDIAFNGGLSVLMGGQTILENLESEPLFNSTIKADVGWHALLSIQSLGSSTVQSTVTCLDNPPLR